MRTTEERLNGFAPTGELDGRLAFFLVGIGGAGMGALARMLKHRGFRVLGTDSTESPETHRLMAEGIDVRIGHSGDGIEADHAVVITDAISLAESPEVRAANRVGAPVFRRSQALGWLLKDRRLVAVTGTHGKTTTTGMLGFALEAAGFDPLVVVGASIAPWGGPIREGAGSWAVAEACEAYDSFHDLKPDLVLLLNLEADHLDYHGSYEGLRDSVVRFVRRLRPGGSLVYCEDDPGAAEVARLAGVASVPFRIADYTGPDPLQLGDQNRLDAAAALVAAQLVGATAEPAAQGISAFPGAERRQQRIPCRADVIVLDDYAHHPTEVRASLQAIRKGYVEPGGRLVVAFQPHLYSRTARDIAAFAEALDEADVVALTDIYPAREDPIPGVSSARIVEKTSKPTTYVPCRHLLPREVAKLARPGDVVVGMGAGNISEFAPAFALEMERRLPGRAIRVAVCHGGDSAEREVSILTGRAVLEALRQRGYDAFLIDVSDLLLRGGDLGRFVGPDRPDVAFLAVHGTHGEDGALQGLMELLGLPYTGSGIASSALAMDKAATKRILKAAGIRTPQGQLADSAADPISIQPPCIVKPNAQGSTVGLSFVESPEQLAAALRRAFVWPGGVLVEEWVRGIEISTPVLDDEALMPVEITPATGRYDFESKYTPGATEEIVPARLPAGVLEEARQIALRAHRALNCRGATRTDAIVRGHEIFVLEVNTLPGMTGTSLLPRSAAACGIAFDELCDRLVRTALESHGP